MLSNTNIIKYICCVCTGIIVGGCLFYFGSGRVQSNRITELQHSLTERERELVDSNKRINELVTRLREHNNKAGELVTTMGEQLVRDGDTLTTTAGLINALRTQMQGLQDYYRYICSDSSDLDKLVDMGDN